MMNEPNKLVGYTENAQQAQQAAVDAQCDRPQPTRPTVEGLQNILTKDECSPSPVKIALSSHAADTLRCLFFHGPTWDGNVPSKTGRDELVNIGLAARGHGWQWLTREGVEACFANGIHIEKGRRESREQQCRSRLEEAARQILTY